MGIRNTSYHGWKFILKENPSDPNLQKSFTDFFIDKDGNFFISGNNSEASITSRGKILKSSNQGITWTVVDDGFTTVNNYTSRIYLF